MPRLLIVSNRLPVTVELTDGALQVKRSSGGLATGLSGPHERSGGLWIGWPGDVSKLTDDQRPQLEAQLAELRCVPLYFTPQEIEDYYNSFSNGVLWPLFHYMPDRIPVHAHDWEAYRAANERFAELVVAQYQPGDVIWVQDYQLALLPALLRRRLRRASIGFFLHIPFPSSEVLRMLPWRGALLDGLLGADLIGFHTQSYARHFSHALIHLLGLTPDVDRVVYEARTVRFGAFPMGIDARSFDQDAQAPEIASEVERLRREAGEARLLLGVDRLDYTKGIPRRLLAVERLLTKHPELKGKVRLLQIAVPSRAQVKEYGSFTTQVQEIVGRVNGAYGTTSSMPLHYLYQSFPQRDLVAMYRAAEVMLVTPLRDGMNLVAKEFVASRSDEDGVLILSEFAGAAAEMGEALMVNPYDVDGVAEALFRALTMPPDERRERMRALRRNVAHFDVHHWAKAFLAALDEATSGARASRSQLLDPEAQTGILSSAAERDVLLMLDYDGTLVPFASRPELASPDPDLLELLKKLAQRARTAVHLVSGRPRELLERWFGKLEVGLHAEHGIWSRPAGGEWRLNRNVDAAWKARALPILQQFTERIPGSSIEEKDYSLVWHYRQCDAEFGEVQARELKTHLTEALANVPVAVMSGEKVVEVQPHDVNKGLVAAELCRASPAALAIAAGDDLTDENLFAGLAEGSVSIHVGWRASRARFVVPDHRLLRQFLRALAEQAPGR